MPLAADRVKKEKFHTSTTRFVVKGNDIGRSDAEHSLPEGDNTQSSSIEKHRRGSQLSLIQAGRRTESHVFANQTIVLVQDENVV